MSRNGSGTYSLPAGNPVVTGTSISSTTMNSTLSDIATALTQSLSSDGQTTPTANLPMGSYKLTGLGNATALTDAANLGGVQSGACVYLTSVSGADTITGSATPAPSAYAAGQTFRFVSAGANTGAVTLNVSSLGAKSVTKYGTTALAAGDIPSGAVCEVVYDGTRFQLIGLNAVTAISGPNGSALGGFRNKIINGGMFINQRNTTVNATNSATYGIDRWYALTGAAASGTLTLSRVSGDQNSQYAARLAKTSGTFSSTLNMIQIIESANCYALSGKTVTLSFRARVGSTHTGASTPTKVVYTGTGTDQGSASGIGTWTGFSQPAVTDVLNPTLTTSFQTYSCNVTLGSNVAEIAVQLGMSCTGSAGSANDYIEITDVQLEAGSVATPFETRSVGQELALCQRYYYRLSATASNTADLGVGPATTTTAARATFPFPVQMRSAPTAIEVSGTATDYTVFNGSSINCSAVPTFIYASVYAGQIQATVASGLTAGQCCVVRAALATSGYLGWSAEL